MDADRGHGSADEVKLLSTVAANHLFLGQFEPLRASLLALRAHDPDLAVAVLQTIVFQGGRFEGVLWSRGCASASDLAWLAVIELLEFVGGPVRGFGQGLLRLKVEFLVLVQLACWNVEEAGGEEKDRVLGDLRWMLELGVRGLRSGDGELLDETLLGAEEALGGLRKIFLDHAEVFDALSWNIHGQIHGFVEASDSKLALSVRGEEFETVAISEGEWNMLLRIQMSVQMAHLGALKECTNDGDLERAISHIRYLHPDFGVEESEYRMALKTLIKKFWTQKVGFGESWYCYRSKMLMMYCEALSANSLQSLKTIQVLQDELLSNEFQQEVISNDVWILPPLQKYMASLKHEDIANMDDQSSRSMIIEPCLRDMFHSARISGTHILGSITNLALSAVKRGKLQEACDVLSLFPLLHPLVAVMGWDLLSGKPMSRKSLMHMLWVSKSQALRLEESSLYGKQSDEISCVEYLCDLLCFHLDVACFVACVNSGHNWNSKSSILFSKQQDLTSEIVAEQSDPFVENFVLERLSIQTPLRVIFDVVPEITFQDAIEIISMQPMNSGNAARKRLQDIELIHLRYAVESTVLSLAAMEKSLSDEKDNHHQHAMLHLRELKGHLEAVSSLPRKVFMLCLVISLLRMDKLPVDTVKHPSSSSCQATYNHGQHDFTSSVEGGNTLVVSFTSLLLDILRSGLPSGGAMDHASKCSGISDAGRQALEWRVSNVKHFIEDWQWRLSILEQLLPLSGRPWNWKEALIVLRAAPSNLLNLCMQRAKYNIGEEAVHRFSLPPEDKAALELTEWVAGAFRKETMDESVSRVTRGVSGAIQELDFSSLRSQLGPLVSILLCIDIAAVSARSAEMCSPLLNQARELLSEIYPGASPKAGATYWNQIKEVAVISVVRHVLQRFTDLLDQEKVPSIQELFARETLIDPQKEPVKQDHTQRALVLLNVMIDDAHKGKRQFLSGKLHNLARVVTEEDRSNDRKEMNFERGVVLGLGLNTLRPAQSSASVESSDYAGYVTNEKGKRLLAPLSSKTSTYISAFIIYIATIGDIVDGVDTTHDFNFFSLVYEWPKDLLIGLAFERGSIDAAAKIADIMGSDFVHEIISACVPPVLPPRCDHGWACIPLRPNLFKMTSESNNSYSGLPTGSLYPLRLHIVEHLAKVSPVRAILACVFGSILSNNSGSLSTTGFGAENDQAPDAERLFYEFALDQSERFPTLNRWIQMQSNLHKVSDSTIVASYDDDAKAETKNSAKRSRESETDTESDIGDIGGGSHASPIIYNSEAEAHATSNSWRRSTTRENAEIDTNSLFSLDLENEGPYVKAVERLIDEGKLVDALALSDRCLRDGASDHLLQLLIEHEEDSPLTSAQTPSFGPHHFYSNNWKYCLRLKDKELAGGLALKYLHRWELSAALEVLTMCSCHLAQNNPMRNEVLQMKQALEKYGHILSADDSHQSWQGVESEYKEDPEGLALRLASKGAVSAALEVAESAALSIDLRRELQGRQLVKLLTAHPLSGGGPAQASRFLSSLRDPDDALPVAMAAMHLLPDLRSKQLLVHFFLKRRSANLLDDEVSRLNSWALGLGVLALLPSPWQQRCSALHEHPHLILEVLLMMKQLQYASLILKDFPSLRENSLIFTYSRKAIAVGAISTAREPRTNVSGPRTRQKPKTNILSRSNITNSFNNLQKEARKAFSWAPRDTGNKISSNEAPRKRKGSVMEPSEHVPREPMSGIQEEHVSATFHASDVQDRVPLLSASEGWVLTGDSVKDNAVRSSHRYESAPDIVLFKGLLSLCLDDLVSARGALDMSIAQMKSILSSQKLPLDASMDAIGQAYHATETFVQALTYAKGLLKKVAGNSDLPTSSEKSRDTEDAYGDTSSSSVGSQYGDELSELQAQADIWLGRAELLQSLLGSGIVASLADIADKDSSGRLRDRLIEAERYSMAVYTCKKCKIDVFPVWNAWGLALIRMEHYAQARVKFKQALQLQKADPFQVVQDIIKTMEGGPPVDVSAVLSLYEHLAKSAPTILDDSLSADSYLNVLYVPSTFPRSEKNRTYYELANGQSHSSSRGLEDGPCSNLDNIRYAECIHYLQEYARPHMLSFMFKHGHFDDACLLFFPPNVVPLPPQTSTHGSRPASPSPQRLDPLATEYGTIEDLCDFCISYNAMVPLGEILSTRTTCISENAAANQYVSSALSRICNYCETHRHFNFLFKFQVIKGDHVAAGLCCIQLFMNSSSQEEAIKHLENAKMHFEEELSTRVDENIKPLLHGARGKGTTGKLSQEALVKLSACVTIQVDVIKCLNDMDGPQWKHSLFGNPNGPETFRRRCAIAETLAEKNFDLAFGVIYQFNLPAVDIYAAVAAVLAEKKRSHLLTTLFGNIKGTIDNDDWDQVLGAAINVYANRHKERPDRLIDMLISSHRKVLACVICGRLKSAFQIASRSGSVADVQYVAHQALHANALPVLDMCKQWLAQYM